MEGRGAILIGNVTKIDSGVLSAALTALIWCDRILGKSEMCDLPMRCIWVTTGNNPNVSTEIARRSIRIRLDAGVERPWQRENFKHPHLKAWVEENREKLVHAALVLIRAWVQAGMPHWQGKPLGSYEQWCAVIGGILENAEIEGFLGNLEELYDVSDVEGACWQEFVEKWWTVYKTREVSTSDLVHIALESSLQLSGDTNKAKSVSFGMRLAQKRDQIIGGYKLVLGRTVRRAARWKLVEV